MSWKVQHSNEKARPARSEAKFPVFPEKTVDGKEKYAIILCSAINIPEQSYDAQYKAGGEVRCETMSNVIVKESRRSAKGNTMRSQA